MRFDSFRLNTDESLLESATGHLKSRDRMFIALLPVFSPSASSLVSASVTPAGQLICVITSCLVIRAGSLFCKVLTVWYSQLLMSDSREWRVSPDKTQFNQTSAVFLGDHPLTFLLLGVEHAGLGLVLVVWACFAPTKRARSHSTLQISSRSSRDEKLQRKDCCRLHCWLRSTPRTQ